MPATDKAAADLADANPATGIVWAYRFNADGSAERIPNDSWALRRLRAL